MTFKNLKGPFALGASLILFCTSVATLAYAIDDIQKPAQEEQEAASTQQQNSNTQLPPGHIASILSDEQTDESAMPETEEPAIDEDEFKDTDQVLDNSISSSAQQENQSTVTTQQEYTHNTVHHSAYWKEAVYRTIQHNAGTCQTCGKHHESSFTERSLEKYIEHTCSACGKKHAQAYDE